MVGNTETANTGTVKKQTLVMAVLLSLCVGFIAGTIYASFKLALDKQEPPPGHAALNKNQTGGQPVNSIEFSAKILPLEQYLKQHPEDAEAWTQLGNLFFDLNQVKEAIDAYEKSLAIEPGKIG
ncbi:MAG: tetratricopeptide repeat protein, partial [Desulfobacula sp.]|nr:tetratricopeptide repeat protein [Desulfobacula sp.]